ncbi:DNA polymerase Y family protein [Arthrobacter agilis]|uniref:DNA polymerase Y family protein n=1 Tax=Arthrobacter agilis TaxID=37921 RepID=UPI002366CC44|nr:DNA polymerase Y family protein [Arthrobacter agilis]WDF33394.1 DNA polymerase Y family protein [Arthrobacter agilis]
MTATLPTLPTSTAAATRTLMFWCPDWPITAALREHALPADSALALVDRGEVFACSPAARQDGIKRGLRVREAQARSTGLACLPYDPSLDDRTFEPVTAAVETTMPGVQVIRPGLCAIRVKGPTRYYGSEAAAAGVVFQTLAAIGLTDVRIGIADGPFAAEQAARATDQLDDDVPQLVVIPPGESAWFLGSYPLEILEQPKLTVLLKRLGIRSLGDFAALRASDVRNRFGIEGALAHRQASGLDHRNVVAHTPPPHLDAAVDFEPPLARIDQLAFAFRSRAGEFVDTLREAGLVCTALHVSLHTESGESSERRWQHPRWFDADDVVDRVRWQLQGTNASDHGLTSGVSRVHVVPEIVENLSDHADGLWGTGPDEGIHHGLARVQSMLGHGAVLTAVVAGGRLLADRRVFIPWGDAEVSPQQAAKTPVKDRDQPWPGRLPGPAPATVFAEPVAAAVVDSRGNTVDVDARGLVSADPAFFSAERDGTPQPVHSWAGPWPINERWWDPSGRVLNRFQLVDHSGSAWLLLIEDHRWWIEARYD